MSHNKCYDSYATVLYQTMIAETTVNALRIEFSHIRSLSRLDKSHIRTKWDTWTVAKEKDLEVLTK